MTFSPPCRRWLFKLLNEGNRREWRTLYIVLGLTLVLANLTYQAIMTPRTCRRGVHSPISCSKDKISQRSKGERGLWDWVRLWRPFILFENTQGKLRIFFIISYVFLLDLTVRTIEPPVRKETWKELIHSFNRGKALNCPYIKRGHKINDKKNKQKNKGMKDLKKVVAAVVVAVKGKE